MCLSQLQLLLIGTTCWFIVEPRVAVGSPEAYVAICSKTPVARELMEIINRQGPRAVTEVPSCGGWVDVFYGVGSGDRDWLEVARQLEPYTDAGQAEELLGALAEALQKKPADVLTQFDGSEHLEYICRSPLNDVTLAEAEAFERKSIRAVRSVKNPELKASVKRCLGYLGAGSEGHKAQKASTSIGLK